MIELECSAQVSYETTSNGESDLNPAMLMLSSGIYEVYVSCDPKRAPGDHGCEHMEDK